MTATCGRNPAFPCGQCLACVAERKRTTEADATRAALEETRAAQAKLDAEALARAKPPEYSITPLSLSAILSFDTQGQLGKLTLGSAFSNVDEYPTQGESAGELFDRALARVFAIALTRSRT